MRCFQKNSTVQSVARETYFMKLFLFFLLSAAVLQPFSVQAENDEDFSCTIRRWHYSGIAGWELLAVVDTHSNGPIGRSSGYLYSRYTKDLKDYFVTVEKNREGELTITLYRDPNHKHLKRTVLVDHEIVKWQRPYVATAEVRLLDGKDFSHDGEGELTALCYKIH